MSAGMVLSHVFTFKTSHSSGMKQDGGILKRSFISKAPGG